MVYTSQWMQSVDNSWLFEDFNWMQSVDNSWLFEDFNKSNFSASQAKQIGE